MLNTMRVKIIEPFIAKHLELYKPFSPSYRMLLSFALQSHSILSSSESYRLIHSVRTVLATINHSYDCDLIYAFSEQTHYELFNLQACILESSTMQSE